MSYTKAGGRAVQKYNKKNYDVIMVRVKKGQKETIKKRADETGQSLNSYILGLIKKDVEGKQ